jgi:hypothetical protein
MIPQPVPEDLRPVLVLHVTRNFYDKIQTGLKIWEFREIKGYWTKRLKNRQYAAVVIANRQNTKFSDPEWLIFDWNGYEEQIIMPVSFGASDLFGTAPKKVYAIKLLKDPATFPAPAH